MHDQHFQVDSNVRSPNGCIVIPLSMPFSFNPLALVAYGHTYEHMYVLLLTTPGVSQNFLKFSLFILKFHLLPSGCPQAYLCSRNRAGPLGTSEPPPTLNFKLKFMSGLTPCRPEGRLGRDAISASCLSWIPSTVQLPNLLSPQRPFTPPPPSPPPPPLEN